MWRPKKIMSLELSEPLDEVVGLGRYREVNALLFWRGTPIGWHTIPIVGDRLDTGPLAERVLDKHLYAIAKQALQNALLCNAPLATEQILDAPNPAMLARPQSSANTVSVVVCTRDRPIDLKSCLESILNIDPAPGETIVIDNAPASELTRHVVGEFSGVRYVQEPRPGLDWARNRGLLESKGEIVAFTDDDVIVDTRWIGELVRAMDSQPKPGIVTGLIVPLEFESEAQEQFEIYGGFGRGFEQRSFFHPRGEGPMPWKFAGTGHLGSGANMAIHREVFEHLGGFAPELDTGTATEGGGDLEMYYRTLKGGYSITYHPSALVWHRHREDPEKLLRQIGSWGIGVFAALERARTLFPDEAANLRRFDRFWRKELRRRSRIQYIHPNRLPRELREAEYNGVKIARQRYASALKNVKQIEARFGRQESVQIKAEKEGKAVISSTAIDRGPVAVRSVDIQLGIAPIEDVISYKRTRVFFHVANRPFCELDILNHYRPISVEQLVHSLTNARPLADLLALILERSIDSVHCGLRESVRKTLLPGSPSDSSSEYQLPPEVSVSIVIATCDRPIELQRCLATLSEMPRKRRIEIIVVDNRPSSEVTPPVLKAFPEVMLVSEKRSGLSYARNAGFHAATGDIIVCTDDDVKFGVDWLERLIAPFARNDIDIVCGNVLPMELETISQIRFEQYGGLGKGYFPKERRVEDFFRAKFLPFNTWELGATANAAFRASVIRDHEVGLFEEALGPGVPSGVGEDTYFFYRALQRGYALRYEPRAYVWHEHRKTNKSLRKQLFDYSRGHVAYHLHTLIKDNDFRALTQLIIKMPRWYLRRIKVQFGAILKPGPRPHNLQRYPMNLILWEILGYLAGPWSLWKSNRLVRKLGRSQPLRVTEGEGQQNGRLDGNSAVREKRCEDLGKALSNTPGRNDHG